MPKIVKAYNIYNSDYRSFLEKKNWPRFDCVFADPPDNIGTDYGVYKDKIPDGEYLNWLGSCVEDMTAIAPIVWFSYNSKWLFAMGEIVMRFLRDNHEWWCKPFVQTFTFGQHNQHDLGNNHRPLVRFARRDAKLYPDNIRVQSWRQEHGDKRADPRGRVPGDVFDYTRVTGNSKQRRGWHPTQLNEGLVERCISLSTQPGQSVFDPFGGTGTTLRVCRAINRPCTITEIDPTYCKRIAEEQNLVVRTL